MALDYLYVYICILNNIADIAIIQSSENSDGYAFKPILKLKWTEYATFTLGNAKIRASRVVSWEVRPLACFHKLLL